MGRKCEHADQLSPRAPPHGRARSEYSALPLQIHDRACGRLDPARTPGAEGASTASSKSFIRATRTRYLFRLLCLCSWTFYGSHGPGRHRTVGSDTFFNVNRIMKIEGLWRLDEPITLLPGRKGSAPSQGRKAHTSGCLMSAMRVCSNS